MPKLAWCAAVHKGTTDPVVIMGPWVEKQASFFCEGAWDDEFDKGEFTKGFMTGSGGKITEDGNIIFTSPSHTLERLYSVRVSDILYVSNSLTFLLSLIEDKLDPGYLFYPAVIHSIRYGVNKCRRTFPTLKHRRISLHYYCNLVVSTELTTTEISKKHDKDFINFEHYNSFLKDTVARVGQNAMDKWRVKNYKAIATISSGYDSAASAVIARSAGCTDAITFRDYNDSGAEIARVLKFNVREYDRREYLKHDGFPEAEFLACGTNARDIVMLAFEDSIKQRLLFTGTAGDIIWDKNWNFVSRDLSRWDPYDAYAGSSETDLGEFRLRVGFINLPLPFIGFTSHPSIHTITVSPEMRPWSIGGNNDKPIPRRILEEAGVDREMFGYKKNGAWLPSEVLTESFRSDFGNFCSENWSFRLRSFSTILNIFYWSYAYIREIRRRIEYLVKKSGLRIKVPLLLAPRTIEQWLLLRIGKDSLRPHWGIDKISVRYRIPGEFEDRKRL